MRKILGVIDFANEWVGLTSRWLVVALVLVVTYDVIARYIFNAPTIWGYELGCMIGGSIIILGWGYIQLHHSHIRISILYDRLSPRKRALIDILGGMICFFPLFAILIKTSLSFMWRAWLNGEVMMQGIWYPPAGPFRTIIVIALCLVFLQFIATFIRDLYIIRKGKPI